MSETANPAAALHRRWSEVSWKRVIILFGLTFVCLPVTLMILVWFLEPWYFAHAMSHHNPQLGITPTHLRDTSVSRLAPARVQCFEYSFQVPWEHIENRKDFKTTSIIRFNSGQTIMVFDPAGMSRLSDGLRIRAKKLESIFGSRSLSSNYDWMAAELAATPAQIHWWNRTGNVRTAILLGLKEIEVLESTTAIYRVTNDEMQGFQFGDLAASPHRVTVDLFDVNNRWYQMVIASPANGANTITQSDVNAIIASMRPIPHG